ncbi:MAG TPA: hypothetical protein VEA79_08195 [Phenylobacterium sp.]|nr:hypothetical protein [Phenylobacterium sp.]
MLNRLFPRHADNTYQGHVAALWLAGALTFLKAAVALNSIFNTRRVAMGADGIPLARFGPDAQSTILSLFALNAFGWLVLALVGLAVLIRWRSLVPFLLLISLFEQLGRRFIVQSHDIVRADTAIATIVTWGALGVVVLALILSLLPGRVRGAV